MFTVGWVRRMLGNLITAHVLILIILMTHTRTHSSVAVPVDQQESLLDFNGSPIKPRISAPRRHGCKKLVLAVITLPLLCWLSPSSSPVLALELGLCGIVNPVIMQLRSKWHSLPWHFRWMKEPLANTPILQHSFGIPPLLHCYSKLLPRPMLGPYGVFHAGPIDTASFMAVRKPLTAVNLSRSL